MECKNTTATINNFNELLNNYQNGNNCSDEEMFFLCHIGYELAKSLQMDLGKENCVCLL